MKLKLLTLTFVSLFVLSFVPSSNDTINEDLGLCEDACVAYADHIDMNDGYDDKYLIKWRRDLATCIEKMCNTATVEE